MKLEQVDPIEKKNNIIESTTAFTVQKEANDGEDNDNDIITPIGPDYILLETLPHDSSAFTQGLVYVNGTMYEGTGMHGSSELRRVDIRTGRVLQRHRMDAKYFGEGIAFYQTTINRNNNNKNNNTIDDNNNSKGESRRLIQLTWQEQTGFIYDADTFQVLQEFHFTTTTNEGWGITYNPNRHEFIVTDGSEYLHMWDATTLQQVRRVRTTMRIKNANNNHDGRTTTTTTMHHDVVPIPHLNEIEWDRGTILANVWYRDIMLRINPDTGNVLHVYDFTHLHPHRKPGEDCFNGIALGDADNELYVTGKMWPSLYRVKLLL